jgi:hypothetical protein
MLEVRGTVTAVLSCHFVVIATVVYLLIISKTNFKRIMWREKKISFEVFLTRVVHNKYQQVTPPSHITLI